MQCRGRQVGTLILYCMQHVCLSSEPARASKQARGELRSSLHLLRFRVIVVVVHLRSSCQYPLIRPHYPDLDDTRWSLAHPPACLAACLPACLPALRRLGPEQRVCHASCKPRGRRRGCVCVRVLRCA